MKGAFENKIRLQQGIVAVEFALIASIFFTVIFAIIEMGRVMYYMNAAAEATRLGARVAVVCDVDASGALVKSKMQKLLNDLTLAEISLSYFPESCTASTCESVTVNVSKSISTFIPFLPLTFNLPSYSTTLPRESLNSFDGSNPICK